MIVHFHGPLGARVQRLKYLLKLGEVLVSLEKYIPGIVPEYSKIRVVNVFLLHFLSCQLGFGPIRGNEICDNQSQVRHQSWTTLASAPGQSCTRLALAPA